MGGYFDTRETRSSDERAADLSRDLPALITHAQTNTGYFKDSLRDCDASAITTEADLVALPIVRKSDMVANAEDTLPLRNFAGVPFHALHTIYQSPGPIYEAGMRGTDWWRFGRALAAVGVGKGDIVQNCFAYHFTPAGMMFESAAAAVGAVVVPAGTGQTEMQATAMANLGVTVYAGTPDYLKAILEKGEALGLDLSSVTRACVSAGPLFPALRQDYEERGITCRQCYGTADVGHIAYESLALDGMIVDEGVIVEIVVPGTGIPVEDGQIGEVVVTTFSHETGPAARLAPCPRHSICARACLLFFLLLLLPRTRRERRARRRAVLLAGAGAPCSTFHQMLWASQPGGRGRLKVRSLTPRGHTVRRNLRIQLCRVIVSR